VESGVTGHKGIGGSILTGYRFDDRGSISGRGEILSPPPCPDWGCETYLADCPVATGACFPGDKATGT
jgi:hypothetical protein